MTFRNDGRVRTLAHGVLLWLVAGAPALAQARDRPNEGAPAPPAGAEASEAATEAAPPGPPLTPPETRAVPPATAATVGLELLPSSGYPAPRVRGIEGGSLWMTMQGWQFPFMPSNAGEAATRIAFSGMVWSDTSYRKVDSGISATDPNLREWRQQSRLVLRATPTYNADDGWFVQGQGELALIGAAVALASENLNADDLYIRIGRWNAFDVTAGRFQGWEVYHFGMGLDLNTVEREGAITDNNVPVGIYGLTFLWDRPNGPGHVAAHVYPTDYLRFEVLGEVGTSDLNQLGVRPVGILDLGLVKLKAGAEYERQTPRQQSTARKDEVIKSGVGGAVQFVLDPHVEAGLSGARAVVDVKQLDGVIDAGKSTTTYSVGGFANARIMGPLIVGVGANYTRENNLKLNAVTGANDIRTHLQAFGAIQYAFWHRFFIKGVVSYADAHVNPLSDMPPISEFHNKMLSGRLRFMYLF
jgi:hypothetical protein